MRHLPIVALLLLAACGGDGGLQRFTPADADARARATLAMLARGQVDSVQARLIPALQGADTHGALAKVTTLLAAPADSMKVVGANVASGSGKRRVNLTYERFTPRGVQLANVATIDSASTWLIEGVGAQPLDRPLEEATRFTLAGHSARDYLWLLVMALTVAFSLGTAIRVAMRRTMPKRWRWVFASLVGVGSFSLNWLTGQTRVAIVYVQLFGGGALRAGPYAPWVFSFCIPVGAFLAWRKMLRWTRQPDTSPAMTMPAELQDTA